MNGTKIHTTDPCDLCHKTIATGGNYKEKQKVYSLYKMNSKRVCRLCAVKNRVI